ncbi:NADPH:quinone reductase-like Zn-dependent oxidoreductase [Glaciihabitans tibetensis]|uniref:NADPH:quinone reductase-like Zn-dependent oxidoreductase n=1 Tax=Glaciihabitans tibetensis TaxID=1266600 RepID=A0A2T0VFS2_9MICO|nr:NADP-dependent oxidoreductase [Glaciihabitans tibetensis]PRY69012.1 NADPH:quinone reductase-like Zn-dependent oxidoreductase [Glaciihabitans tibetensis]
MPSEILFSTFGGPEVLEWTAGAEVPEPLPSQVVIVVAAAAVNALDATRRAGELEGILTTFLPSVIGREAAGVVIARGSAVTDVEVGDEVLGFTDTGAYAQFAALSTYVRKPDSLSWAVAASLPVASQTANRVLNQLELRAGETLVIAGGAGAIGAMAGQLALIRGAKVVATVNPADLLYMRSLGITAVRYGHGFGRRVRSVSPNGIDAALDTSGARILPELVQLTGDPARVVALSDRSAEFFGVQLSQSDPATRSKTRLRGVADLAAAGALSVRIARTYPLSQAAAAHRELAGGGVRGRLVLVNGV